MFDSIFLKQFNNDPNKTPEKEEEEETKRRRRQRRRADISCDSSH